MHGFVVRFSRIWQRESSHATMIQALKQALIQALQQKLAATDQQHVLAFWENLTSHEQQHLADQINHIDLNLLDRLHKNKGAEVDWGDLAHRSEPPPAVRLDDANPTFSRDQAKQSGTEALAVGKVGVLLVAGGQGTRLGYDHPKGMYPVGPVSNRSLFQIHIEKILGTAQRYDTRVPLYLMTSPATHEETVAFLEANDRFGLPAEDLHVFCQGTMPAVDASTGKLLLASQGELAISPDGHGGTLAALEHSGALADAEARGIEQLFYFQVDNALVPICDPAFIGYHLLAESELSIIVVAKRNPLDPCGNAVSVDGRLQIIEYSDLPDDAAEVRNDDGSLRIWAGSIAIHMFDVGFMRRMVGSEEALPFHVAHKKVAYVDPHSGEKIEPTQPNANKFERFIFDLLPHANHGIAIEAARSDVFGPLKNAPGAADSTIDHVHQDIVAQHRRWLEAAGATVAEDVQVEISGLYALDAEQLSEKSLPNEKMTKDSYFV
jgi:UDP-N-acetylglucosamine/UDP-N-acetylgalactosamine diphosphorylase